MPKTNIDCHEKRCKSFIFKYTENLHPVVFYCVRDTAYSRRDFFIYTIKMCTYMKIPNLNNCIFYFIPTIFLSRKMNKKQFIYIYSLMSVFRPLNKAVARRMMKWQMPADLIFNYQSRQMFEANIFPSKYVQGRYYLHFDGKSQHCKLIRSIFKAT